MHTMSPNKDVQKNAQDWVRDLRFSNQVNMQTMGVDTDRVTPQLLLASSNKLLGISRGEQQGDPKDSLQFQRIYGPVEYFAERIQKDGGSVARQMLWKATNKGNLDFIGAGSLQPHVNAVFHESNLSQFVDNSTPFESVDTSQKVTRVGEGGLSDEDSAPIEMRLVQPSYYGFVGGIRTQEKSPGITAYLTKNVMKGTDGKLYQKFINMHTGKTQMVDSQTAAKSVVTTDEYLDSSDSYVYALGGPRGVRIVKRSDVDFILPYSDDAFSAAANTVPMFSGDKAMRLLMGCHHPETPMAVVDSQGYTHIVPAKRLSQMGDIYVLGCDKKGNDQLYPVRKIITRVPERKSKFKKVILSSGRVLITSMQHKWWIYQKDFKLIQAKDLQKGMIVPRSLFTSMPVRPTKIMGVPVTREICVFLGRVIRSLRPTSYSYRVDFVVDPDREVDQEKDILTAIKQLGIKNCNMFHSRGIHAVTIKDPVFQDWVDQNVGKLPEERRIPSEVLSLPQGYTSIFLDSYYKDLQTLGEDNQGDTWLISIANPSLRDSLSFMLSKIYTDTKYRDCTKKKVIHRALQLFPAKTSMGDIVLQKITKVLDVSAPAVMIDIDCDDNVYATANGIITHNSKYVSQAVPLQEREAPLVRGLDAQTGMDMPTKIGKLLGTQWAPKPGMVKAVREDRIDMLYDDGTTGSVPLYKNFPANAKGWLTNYPKVKAGDKVAEGQLLATSNYTDDNGVLAMGRNLRIGYMSYHGGTYEDACTLSQSAARKMGYTTMYKTSMDKEKSIRTAKKLYTTWKPGQYTKEQLDNIGDDGVVKVGATINKGDPVILGIRTTEPSPGTIGKRILSDVTEVWEHANPGTVTDVVNGKNGIKVFATVSSPLREGDKVTQEHGGKGTVAQILPDDKMPRDAKGRPLDILFDPLGIVSRCYDEQTQFLTEEGWKLGKDVKDSDKLLSWDLKTESFSYLPQQEPFYKKEYKGTMYKASNKEAQLQVTPKHRVAYKWPGQDAVREGFIEDIYGKSCYLPSAHWCFEAPQRHSSPVFKTVWKLISSSDWTQMEYKGIVYCPTVSAGYVLTKRNGKIVVAHNTNPSQLMQAGLGKVAQKIGQPIVVPQFMPKGQSRLKFVKDLMKQHNVPWKEDVYDPDTGRTIKNVYTGVMYFLPLKHIADTKMSARGTAKYSAQGVPLGGGEEGCFPAMQNIITLHGEQSIAHICEKKIPEYVMSWDEERKEWRWKQITDWFTYRAKVQNILNIFTENALSICGGKHVKHTNSSYPTKNHKMYMYDGSIKLAGELKVGDYLAGIGAQYTEDQIQALYGTLMGDSCRNSSGGIQCMHSIKQSAYINYKRDIFAAVGASRVSEPREVKGGVMGRDGVWKEYKPTAAISMQVPKSYYVQKALQLTTDSAGKRHLTVPVLEAMGEFGFCLWFLDDGSIHNQRKPTHHIDQPQARIATHSFSVEEVEEAAKWLQKNLLHVENGTRITIYKGVYDQDQPYLNFRREASWAIARILAKHIPWEVIPDSKTWLKQYCKEVQEKTPCVKHNFMSPLGIVPLKIKEIKPYKHDKPNVTEVNVYDFTVEDTHNYALTGGVRVSNSKKIGSLESAALVGHGVFDFLQDAKLIRGQQNSDFWRQVRSGQIPAVPGQPLAHKKFFAHLQASGMQIKRDNEGVTIFALSNKDVNELAGTRELKSTDTYEQKSFRPIDGGLFGTDIFGPQGDKWAYIQLDSPLPNPVMQEPLARLFNIPDREFQAIVRGKGSKEGLRNASDMKRVLSKMDLQKEADKALQELKNSSKSQKDKALKRYVAIARMRDAGVRPQEYMLDRIPVLPPKYRPITSHGGLTMVADSNYLYSQLLNARDDLREAEGLPEEYKEQGLSNLYSKWKQLVGLYDPSDVKLKSKNVKGLLKWALGSKGPKCYDDQTEVLTERGWMPFKDYTDADIKVATVNPVTDAFEWQKPTEIIHEQGPAFMVHIKNRYLDSMVTLNHEHYVSLRQGCHKKATPYFAPYKKYKVQWLLKHHYRMRMKTAATAFQGNLPQPPISVANLTAFAEFVGWFIAQGFLHAVSPVVYIAVKANGRDDALLQNLYQRLGVLYARLFYKGITGVKKGEHGSVCNIPEGYEIVHYKIHSKDLYNWLLYNIGKGAQSKKLSKEVLEWSPQYLRALWTGWFRGDGSKYVSHPLKKTGRATWQNRDSLTDSGNAISTVSKYLVDNLMQIGAKLGVQACVVSPPDTRAGHPKPVYRVSLHGFSYAITQGQQHTHIVPYVGNVHCVTVPNGLVITRRNNRVLVSGNSSAYQQKVLGSTVDTVGRGVIIPSTKIKLNQVGMPVQMAWNLYSPFVTRKLVQQGYSPVDALKLIKERKPVAMQALAEAVKERPCVINRAPSLHKLSLIGLNTKLTNGHAIKINPSIVSTLAADFDGNCCDFDSEIIVKVSKSGLDKLEKGCRLYQTLTKESSMITTETRIEIRKEENNEASYGCIKIGEFPRFGTPVKDKNGADVYKVPEGYQVEACDPVTGERGFYDIEALTVEDDCDTVKVEAGNHSVIVSSNESLAVFDTASGKLTKVAPKDLNGRLVPILKKDVAPFGNSGNRDVGWLIGSLISDGWVTSNVVGYAKLEEVKRKEIERIFRDIDPNFLLKEYTEQPEEGKNKLGESAKIHIYSPNLAEFVRQLNILDEEGDMSKKTACRKQINRNLIRLGSEEFLWGILSGLIDGDGSIIMNTTMKNPRFGVRYSTSSPSLRDTFCTLLYRLGIRYSITTTPPRNWSNEAYTICPSTIDMYENIDKLTCIGSREKEMIQKWKDAAPVYEDKKDQVPVSDEEWEALKKVCNNKTGGGIYYSCMKKKLNRSAARYLILQYSTYLKLAAPSLLKRAEEKNTLWYPAEVTEDTGKRQVFDLMVKDAKVFAVNNGFVIWDTVNLHVPVSQKAVQDVRTKMMPEQNLISLRKGKAQYIPQKLYTQGLYVATRMGQAKDIKVFPGISEARKEYLKGNIDIDTPIVIKQK